MVKTTLAAAHAPFGFPWVGVALAEVALEAEASVEAALEVSEAAVLVEAEPRGVGSYQLAVVQLAVVQLTVVELSQHGSRTILNFEY